MPKPGDIVTLSFRGATGIKRRPAVVISTEAYHASRPDIIVGSVTTKIAAATSPSDHVIEDWADAGLHRPSAFRAYLIMTFPDEVQVVGHLSDRDWLAIRRCLAGAISVPEQ
jgi:mRNA interferase MazF